MAAIPESTKTSLAQRLRARARAHWPQLADVQVRYRGQFAYVTAKLADGELVKLGKDGTFQSGHFLVPQRGLALFVNAFNFPAWGLWEKAAPALLSGVPVVVHEANKLPGISNRIGARFARFVGTTFRETTMKGARLIGMPMRRSITHPTVAPAEARVSFGLDPDRPTLLVSGGSQGARSINVAVTEARDAILAAGIQILHVLGPKNFTPDLVPVHGASGAVYLPVEFVDDMALAYAAAYALAALLVFAPWLVRNALYYDNPVYPFVFESAEMDAIRQDWYSQPRSGLIYGANAWQIPLMPLLATIAGSVDAVSGVLQSLSRGDLTARMEGDFHGVFARMRDDANATVAQLTDIVGRMP